jgi:hypothetical protein
MKPHELNSFTIGSRPKWAAFLFKLLQILTIVFYKSTLDVGEV